MYHGDFAVSTVVRLFFNTHKADGTPITLAGSPAISIYKDASTTESTSGVTLTVDFDSRTGMHLVAIDTSADGTFYASGSDFRAVITTGTVDSISVVGSVVGTFSLQARSALRPATAGRTLVVDVNGLADATAVKVGPTGAATAQTAKDIGGAVPNAAAGAAGGLLISGSNAGTTTLAALTITGVTTYTGNVVFSDGITINAPSTANRSGISIAGNGSGHGLWIVAGSTGHGINITTTDGHGILATASGTNRHGANFIGGTGGTSDGFRMTAGTGGTGLRAAIIGNITGTLDTVTTLTNLPSIPANWLTAAGIAADAITAAKVAADVGAEIADAVWDEAQSGHATAGTFGLFLDIAVSSRLATSGYTAPPSAAVIADAVWDELASGHTVAGSFGEAFSSGSLDSGTLQSGTSTGGRLRAGAPSVSLVGGQITFAAGTGAGQRARIATYNTSTKDYTIDGTYVVTPDNTTTYWIEFPTAIPPVDLSTIKTQTITCAAGVTVLASVGTAATSTAQTGDSFARIGAAGVGLTNLGDVRIANLDAAVSSRSTYSGGAVASVTAGVTLADGAITSAKFTLGTVNGAATGFLERLKLLCLRLLPEGASGAVTAPKTGNGNLIIKNSAGATISTQAVTDDGTTQTLNKTT